MFPIWPRSLTGGPVRVLTVVGLGHVLMTFAGLLLGGAISGARSAEDAARAGDLASAYLQVQDAFSREDTIEDVYKDDPDPALHADFERAAADFDAALTVLDGSEVVRDRALARRARLLHARYAAAMREIFVAAGRGDDDAIERINDERMDPAQDALQPLVNGAGPTYAVEQLDRLDALRHRELQLRDVTFVVVPIGALLYLLTIAVFAAYRRRLDRELLEAARTDHLTGLPNSRALYDALAGLGDGPNVAALLDVVGLKQVNDYKGHLAGDELLRSTAYALRDDLGDRGTAYRIGGDEFAVVLPGADETQGLALVASLVDAVTALHPPGMRAGVGADGDGLLAAASAALLEARRTSAAIATESRTEPVR